jgi:LPXTG-motif cell wall-anchored protein
MGRTTIRGAAAGVALTTAALALTARTIPAPSWGGTVRRVLLALTVLVAWVAMAAPATATDQEVRVDVEVTCAVITVDIAYEPGTEFNIQFLDTDNFVTTDADGHARRAFGSRQEPLLPGEYEIKVTLDSETVFDEKVTVEECPSPPPERTLVVTDFDCESVAVSGTGWPQTEATVELAIPPAEGGESRDDLVVIEQVFPDEDGNIGAVLTWPSPPRPGMYTVVVLIDNIQRDPQAAGFEVTGCQPTTPTPASQERQLPHTGSGSVPTLLAALALLAAGAGLLFGVRRRS